MIGELKVYECLVYNNSKLAPKNLVMQQITQLICHYAAVDAIYLYGSRAKNTHHDNSDWDIAVIFTEFETDTLERLVRPQLLEAAIERELKLYNKLSIVDLEIAPLYLQYSIVTTGIKYFDRNVPHVKRIENSIFSKWEQDYARYCLRTSLIQTST